MNSRILFLFISTLCLLGMPGAAQSNNNYTITEHVVVEPEPGLLREIGLAVGLTDKEEAYSVALITGVDKYPLLGRRGETLTAASTDLVQLTEALRELGFNDVLVVWNEDFNEENLRRVLRDFVDPRLAKHGRSRFLLAHTGHGMSDGDDGYLLTSRSQDFDETSKMISLSGLRDILDPTIETAFQSLVLLNACYGGTLVTSFGGRFIPKHPGSHAITAGGSDELTWGTERNGSIFFDTVIRGLSGAADTLPKNTSGDGVVTTFELYSYLRQTIQSESNHVQNPDMGKLRPDNNNGEFFFPVASGIDLAQSRADEDSATRVSFGTGDLLGYRGQIAAPMANASVGLTSTLPDEIERQVVEGGTLDISILYDETNGDIYYRDIAFRSEEILYEFSQSVQVGLTQTVAREVKVRLDFRVYVRLDRRSPAVKIKSGNSGEFELERFTTAECNFNCYDIEVAGRWEIEVDDEKQEGRISAHNNGHGVGADISASLRSDGFPGSLTLSKLKWHGNHNKLDRSFPPLVDIEIDGVTVRIEAPLVSFNGASALRDGSYEPAELLQVR